ncbi:MAG: hypothetical protein M3Q23_15020 [Actinomycetota bacterium]|nr:hypothetical protein [Actinomycetota bacterium]
MVKQADEDVMQLEDAGEPDAREIDVLADRLHPAVNRAQVLVRFDERFASGSAPDPLPDGFLPGRLLATSTWAPLDGFLRRVAGLWMPWQGKTLHREASTGVNRFLPNVRVPMRTVWPGYTPEYVGPDRIEAFPFRTRVAPGELDPGVDVLKIDYDFEANPDFMIRRILDELVQVAPGRYLGKVLFRARRRFYPIGFFSLRTP